MPSRDICDETFHNHEAGFEIHANAFFFGIIFFLLSSVKLTFWTKPWFLLCVVRSKFIVNRSWVIVEFLCLDKFLKNLVEVEV